MREAVNELKNILHDKAYEVPKITIVDTLRHVIVDKGLNKGIALYEKLKKDPSSDYNFGENELNILGYQLMTLKKNEEAIGVLELNNQLFNGSANTFDSVGDAYLAKGDTIKALEFFHKAFAQDSTMTFSLNKAEKLEGK